MSITPVLMFPGTRFTTVICSVIGQTAELDEIAMEVRNTDERIGRAILLKRSLLGALHLLLWLRGTKGIKEIPFGGASLTIILPFHPPRQQSRWAL